MSKEKDVTETVISNRLASTKRRVKLFEDLKFKKTRDEKVAAERIKKFKRKRLAKS